MNLDEMIEKIYEEEQGIEGMASAHNLGNTEALNDLPAAITAQVQNQIRAEYGEVLELVHGSPDQLPADLNWRENSSFTDEFDLEFAGEDGYIAVAQIPVSRIKFYLPGENEFVITAGQLNCEVDTVTDYFGL